MILREPFQLGLCLLWFWVCILYFRKEREFAVKCVALSALFQFIVATYCYAAILKGFVPVPAVTYNYLLAYATRQALYVGDNSIPRMAGTFDESPLFGLFMLSCFVVLILHLVKDHVGRGRGWVIAGSIAAGIGVIASFSDQVLLGLAVLLVPLAFQTIKLGKSAQRVAIVICLVSAGYVVEHSIAKSLSEAQTSVSIYGKSLGERAFHAGYAMTILTEEQSAIFFGIGPGRYGDYVSTTGIFPSTVTPQVMPVEWAIGYGLIGFIAISAWLFQIFRRARLSLGILGIGAFAGLIVGNLFQARWLWEGWFFALAYLYAYTASASTLHVPARKAGISTSVPS